MYQDTYKLIYYILDYAWRNGVFSLGAISA